MNIQRPPKFDLVLIGHFAQDTIRHGQSPKEQKSIGGGVTFGSIAVKTFSMAGNVGIISKAGRTFKKNLAKLKEMDLDLQGVDLDNSDTTSFYHHYIGRDRKSKITARAPSIGFEDIPVPYFGSRAVHFTPIAGEFNLTFLRTVLHSIYFQDTIFGLDIQGLIRIINETGGVSLKSDPDFNQNLFKTLQEFGVRMYFKGSDEEILAVAPNAENDLIKATEHLGVSGAHILTTLGPEGLYYKAPGEEIIHIPAYIPKICTDETGAGDVAMATLLFQLGQMAENQRSVLTTVQAIKVASAAVSFLIESPGPQGCVPKELVLARIREITPNSEEL